MLRNKINSILNFLWSNILNFILLLKSSSFYCTTVLNKVKLVKLVIFYLSNGYRLSYVILKHGNFVKSRNYKFFVIPNEGIVGQFQRIPNSFDRKSHVQKSLQTSRSNLISSKFNNRRQFTFMEQSSPFVMSSPIQSRSLPPIRLVRV